MLLPLLIWLRAAMLAGFLLPVHLHLLLLLLLPWTGSAHAKLLLQLNWMKLLQGALQLGQRRRLLRCYLRCERPSMWGTCGVGTALQTRCGTLGQAADSGWLFCLRG